MVPPPSSRLERPRPAPHRGDRTHERSSAVANRFPGFGVTWLIRAYVVELVSGNDAETEAQMDDRPLTTSGMC
jgi:hypothetical protein